MPGIITADIHLTSHPKDEYRWGLFPWLAEQARKHRVDFVALLGDLTDAKDRHAEALVNRVVDNLEQLGQAVNVVFDPGNHDGIEEGKPFFRFTNHIFNVTCLLEPMSIEWLGQSLFLPHTRNYKEAWSSFDFSQYDYIFTHQTYDGCKAENGQQLTGIPPSVFAGIKARVWSGDIHVPQKVSKNVEYVGAPYHVHFGDRFEPRVPLLMDNGKVTNLHFPCIGRELVVISCLDDLEYRVHPQGTQVKVRMNLSRKDLPNWEKLKRHIADVIDQRGWENFGIEPALTDSAVVTPHQVRSQAALTMDPVERLKAYGTSQSLPKAKLDVGLAILGEVV